MQQRFARYLTFSLAACTVVSNVAYLVYLRSHSMVRTWSGINGVLLGLFFFAWALTLLNGKSRWGALAIALIGALNVTVGLLFFR
jgi:hypothetical protein